MRTGLPPCCTYAGAAALPSAPGTYALLLQPQKGITLEVGRLGLVRLPPGVYVYAGSALGAGGIRARLTHHLRSKKRIHWHIDAFTQQCPVEGVCWVLEEKRLECSWVRSLLDLPGALAPIPGFGNSDCLRGCPAHLVELAADASIADVQSAVISELSRSSYFVR